MIKPGILERVITIICFTILMIKWGSWYPLIPMAAFVVLFCGIGTGE